MKDEPSPLRRSLTLTHVTLYGLGATVGAGIYALLGEAAGEAGMLAPLCFVFASLLAAFTALSFGELCARYPRSAGEAVYVREGFGHAGLATTVGLLVVLAGIVSSATIVNALVGYLAEFVSLPRTAAILGAVAVLAVIASWGIGPAVSIAGLITVIEIGGILLVVWATRGSWVTFPDRLQEFAPPMSLPGWHGIFSASLLAFYAFIGFEDMVNVAEEVKNVRRNLPLAIVLTLVITTLLYIILSLAAVLAVPPAELAASGAPMALVYERGIGGPSNLISFIGMVALINGVLIQIIMASRVLYGLARQRSLPAVIGWIHPGRRTPLIATGVVTVIIAALALWFSLGPLARATSLITLAIFALVNLSLVRIKRRDPTPEGLFAAPSFVPILGATASAGVLLIEAVRQLA